MKTLSKSLAIVWGTCLMAGIAHAQFYDFAPSFSSGTFNITPDGSAAVAVSNGTVYKWTPGAGAVAISDSDWQNTFTAGISNDGNTITSAMVNPGTGNAEAAVWHNGSGWSFLGGLGGNSGGSVSTGYDISGDGQTIVGLGWVDAGHAEGFTWNSSDGMTGLGRPATASSRASAISRDGSTVVGFWESETTGVRMPVRWVNGNVDLFLGQSESGEAMGTNSNGSIVVGYNWEDGVGSRAYWYDGTLHYLDVLPEHQNNFDPRSIANAVSDNGIVVGWSGGDPFWGDPEEGFVWTAQGGMVNAHNYFASLGVNIPSNLLLNSITCISADGSTYGGQAVDVSTGEMSSWIVRNPVPEPATLTALGLGAAALLGRRRKRA